MRMTSIRHQHMGSSRTRTGNAVASYSFGGRGRLEECVDAPALRDRDLVDRGAVAARARGGCWVAAQRATGSDESSRVCRIGWFAQSGDQQHRAGHQRISLADYDVVGVVGAPNGMAIVRDRGRPASSVAAERTLGWAPKTSIAELGNRPGHCLPVPIHQGATIRRHVRLRAGARQRSSTAGAAYCVRWLRSPARAHQRGIDAISDPGASRRQTR
jgi:hypothetical protein